MDYLNFDLRIDTPDASGYPVRVMQKVGGGYIFVHRYLLEHFAAMEGEKTADG